MRLLLAPLLILAFSTATAQEIYTWKDADGVIHHSDSPPPAGSFQTRTIKQRSTPEAVANDEGKTKLEACTKATANVTLITNNPVIRMDLDGDGENELLTAEQRERALARAKAQSTLLCESVKPPGTNDKPPAPENNGV